MAEINLAQMKAANDETSERADDAGILYHDSITANQKEYDDSIIANQKEYTDNCMQLKDQEEKLEQALKDKESEVTRLALENEEHLKRVSELTAYIQQASQDREQIIQQYTSYR